MEINNCQTLVKLLDTLSPYISARSLARICGINEGQMLQYKAGIRNPSAKTILKINKKLNKFAIELQKMKIMDT